jgi:hypothetical protein
MARVACVMTPAVSAAVVSEFVCHLALVPKDDAGYGLWSIDKEPMGETWHDSSWMLRKGLDVIEDLDVEPPPRAWARVWRDATLPEFGFPMWNLTERG